MPVSSSMLSERSQLDRYQVRDQARPPLLGKTHTGFSAPRAGSLAFGLMPLISEDLLAGKRHSRRHSRNVPSSICCPILMRSALPSGYGLIPASRSSLAIAPSFRLVGPLRRALTQPKP